jgi:hypothetical protein
MNGIDFDLMKIKECQYSLAVAGRQIDVLARLIQSESSFIEEDRCKRHELEGDLETICCLAHSTANKIAQVYQSVSIDYQLPGKGFRGA